MAIVTATCPFCGGQTQIEEGIETLCPYCDTPLNHPAAADGFAFAQQPDIQFAPPPAQTAVQTQPVQMQQPAALPQVQPAQPVQQMPQYSPAQLQAAQQKRKNWYILNSSLIGFQALMLAFGILFTVMGWRIGVPTILLWVLSLFGFGAISGLSRPDSAYIERKPFWRNRFVQGITQFWMGAAISGAAGGILFAILAGLFGLY